MRKNYVRKSLTNIAKIAKITNVTKFQKEGPRNVRVHLTKLLSLVPLFSRNNNQTRRGLGRVDVVPLGKCGISNISTGIELKAPIGFELQRLKHATILIFLLATVLRQLGQLPTALAKHILEITKFMTK